MKRSTLLLSILGISAGQACAEAATVLDTVVVSATRSEQATVPTPASISVITSQDIEQSGARSVAELLRGRAGIQVRDGGSGAVFDLRGFGDTAGSNTLIMIDGRRLNNGADIAVPDLTTVALKNIERIEIVQGSAGTLFGNQAVGGVINIITRRPQEFQANFDFTAGSYDSRSFSASVSDRFENGVSYRLAAETRDSDNYRDNNAVDYENLVGRIDYDYVGGSVFTEIHRTNEYLELPGALFADELNVDRRQSVADYANDFQETDTTLGRIGLRHDLNEYWSLETELAYRDVDRVFANSFRGFAVPPSDQTRDVYTFTPRLVGVVPMNGGEAQFTLGADLETTDYFLKSILGVTEVEQRTYGYYLQGVLPINQQWSVTMGARRALVRNDITDSFAFPSGENLDDEVTVGTLGLVFRPNRVWRLFARADENFRFAKVEEHTDAGGSPTGLKNQTGVSYEVGGEWSGEHARVMATVYRLDLDDEIIYDSASGFFGANVNLDSTTRDGLMLEASSMVYPNVEVGINYNYVDAEVDSGTYAGKQVPLVPEHSAALLLDYRSVSNLNLHAELKYVGKQVLGSDFANTSPKLDDFTVVNLSGEYRINGWRFGARVNNLFDEEYSETGSSRFTVVSFFPAPERNFWLTAGYDFD